MKVNKKRLEKIIKANKYLCNKLSVNSNFHETICGGCPLRNLDCDNDALMDYVKKEGES
jgi:hypothetical protein